MSKIILGQTEIDEENLTITYPRTSRIPKEEVTLLKFMLENLEKAVFIDDILMEVWGDTEFFTHRKLEVYLTRIRTYAREFIIQKDNTYVKMSPKAKD